MQRRAALKNLSVTIGGLVALPSWASAWTPETIGGQASFLSFSEEKTLAEIVETIIPETNTPGAKSLKVHQFAMRMISDCYGEEAQKNLKQGLMLADTESQENYKTPFAQATQSQRTAILNKMMSSTSAPSKQFVNMIKNLTIQGYTNSEYYMVNVQKYVMAPGFYHGCVPIKKS